MEEKVIKPVSGFIMVVAQLVLLIVGILSFSVPSMEMAGLFFIMISLSFIKGFFSVEPGTARVISVLGSYKGTVREGGFYWVHPLSQKKKIATQLHALQIDNIRGNDKNGWPLKASLSLSWQVNNAAQALYEVANLKDQVEKAGISVMQLLMDTYPYQRPSEDPGIVLKGNAKALSNVLLNEINTSLENKGVKVSELKIVHLACDFQDELLAERAKILVAQAVEKGLISDTPQAKEQLASQLMVALIKH